MLKSNIGKLYKNFLVTTDNDVWAYYICPLTNITGQNSEEQEKHKQSLNQFFQGLKKYKDFEISINPFSLDLEGRLELLKEEFSDEYEALANDISERTIAILEDEINFLTTEKFFIGVKLNDVFVTESVRGRIWESIDLFASKILAASGYVMDVDKEFIDRYAIVEETLFQRIGSLKGRRVTNEELIHMNHYQFNRGLKSSIDKESMNYHEDYSLTDTIINPSKYQGILELKNHNGTSYVSVLPISNFSTNMSFNHIVQHIQELPFPVEFQIKAHFEPLRGSTGLKGKSERANKRLKNFARESLEMGDSEMKSGRLNRYILSDLNEKIEAKVPIIKWLGAFIVFGKDEKECRKRSAQLINYCETMKVVVQRGLADQVLLFDKFLSGNSLKVMKNWIHYTTVEGLSEMMFGTDNRIGDNVGFPIGRVSTLNNVSNLQPHQIARACRKPVFFNPWLANQPDVAGKASSSPHIAITGPTGGGKSFLAKFIFFLCSLLKGKGLYVDPKSEFYFWIKKVITNDYYREKYPLFISYLESIKCITLDANKKENHGVLDPICFLTGTDAQDTAETIFEQIYDFSRKEDARTEMLRGIKHVIAKKDKGKKVGLMHVIEYMKKSNREEARQTGEALYERVEGSILQLAFSYGETRGLDLTSKITLLQVAGLDVPKATEHERSYTSSQKKSIALMMCLGKFCEKFGLSNPNENTFILFDEAWIFSSSTGGQAIIKSMRRVGRTFNNMMVLITQSIKDTQVEDDSGNFGRIFAFDNQDEREEILEHIGIEKNEKNLEWLKRMPQYHCLYLDIYGNVGRMLVYCPFEEVKESFRTVNNNTSGSAEAKYAS